MQDSLDKTKSQTMSDVSATAWRGGSTLLCYVWSGWHTGELHPYLTQHSTETVTGLLLNHSAGRSLIPAQPIGSMRLANFDAAGSHRHGGLSWLRRRSVCYLR
jgi:hypothetical protein